MGGLDGWVSWYYGHWPQYAAMSGCVALLVLGDGHPAIQVAGVVLLPITILGPAALQIGSMFIGEPGDDDDA